MSEEKSELAQLQEMVTALQVQVQSLQRSQEGTAEAGGQAVLDAAQKLERLNYYRREDTQEWNLLSARINSYIMSQSFLVSAYAASMANPDLRFRLCFPILLSTIGIVASLRAYPGIDGACRIIQLWHEKKEKILEDPCLSDFCDGRDKIIPHSRFEKLTLHLTFRSKVGRRARLAAGSAEVELTDTEKAERSRVDAIHVTSLYFAQSAPKLFGAAWVILLVLALFLHFIH